MPSNEAGTIAIYGPTGIGKTLDAHHTFRHAFTILTERDGLASVAANLGYIPDHVEITSVDSPHAQALNAITGQVAKAIGSGKYRAVILDTGSDLADRLLVAADRTHKGNTYKTFPAVGMQFKDLVRRILALNLWVVALFHEREPSTIEGRKTRGGPKLPGRLVEDVPGMFSLILRASYAADADGKMIRVYRCQDDLGNWVTKDRYAVTEQVQPMDLRPLVWRIVKGTQPEPDWPEKPVLSWSDRTKGK